MKDTCGVRRGASTPESCYILHCESYALGGNFVWYPDNVETCPSLHSNLINKLLFAFPDRSGSN